MLFCTSSACCVGAQCVSYGLLVLAKWRKHICDNGEFTCNIQYILIKNSAINHLLNLFILSSFLFIYIYFISTLGIFIFIRGAFKEHEKIQQTWYTASITLMKKIKSSAITSGEMWHTLTPEWILLLMEEVDQEQADAFQTFWGK